jgi:serine/threonine protein kinase
LRPFFFLKNTCITISSLVCVAPFLFVDRFLTLLLLLLLLYFFFFFLFFLEVENVIIDHTGHVKLVDFGLAVALPITDTSSSSSSSFTQGSGNSSCRNSSSNNNGGASSGNSSSSSSNNNNKRSGSGIGVGVGVGGVAEMPLSPTGSLMYMAPELLECRVGGRFTDWWAVGVLAHELLTGRSPWSSLTDKEAIRRDIVGVAVMPPPTVGSAAGKFVCGLLRKDHRRRLGAQSGEQVLNAPFFAASASASSPSSSSSSFSATTTTATNTTTRGGGGCINDDVYDDYGVAGGGSGSSVVGWAAVNWEDLEHGRNSPAFLPGSGLSVEEEDEKSALDAYRERLRKHAKASTTATTNQEKEEEEEEEEEDKHTRRGNTISSSGWLLSDDPHVQRVHEIPRIASRFEMMSLGTTI